MLPHSSSIRDFYHFDDTKDNQRFFLIARPLWVVLKDVVCLPSPISSLCLSLSSSLLPFLSPPPTCTQPMQPLLCVLLLHLCSDYSSIGSHADVAIGRYADLAIDTHKRPRRCLRGYWELEQCDQAFVVLHSDTKGFISTTVKAETSGRNVKADTMAIWKMKVIVWFMIKFNIIYVNLMEYPTRLSFFPTWPCLLVCIYRLMVLIHQIGQTSLHDNRQTSWRSHGQNCWLNYRQTCSWK